MSNIIKDNSNNNVSNITKPVEDLIKTGNDNPKGLVGTLAAAAIALAAIAIKTIGKMNNGGK